MRHAVNSLILIAALAGSAAHAGEEATTARTSVLKLHPLPALGGPLLGVFMLPVELELGFHPNFSFYVLGSPLLSLSGSGGGVALNAGLRGYLSGNAPDGLWMGGQVGLTFLTVGTASATIPDLQLHLGYQWVLDNGFSISVGGGISLGQLAAGQFPVTFELPLGFAW